MLARVGAREGAPSRVTMGVRVGMGVGVVPFQGQSFSRASSGVVVAVAVTLVVVSAGTVAVIGRAVAGASTTTGGMLGHATADMVPFHRRRAVVGRPGRKGTLWARQGCTGLTTVSSGNGAPCLQEGKGQLNNLLSITLEVEMRSRRIHGT